MKLIIFNAPSFPRRRESSGALLGPRLRGDDDSLDLTMEPCQ